MWGRDVAMVSLEEDGVAGDWPVTEARREDEVRSFDRASRYARIILLFAAEQACPAANISWPEARVAWLLHIQNQPIRYCSHGGLIAWLVLASGGYDCTISATMYALRFAR